MIIPNLNRRQNLITCIFLLLSLSTTVLSAGQCKKGSCQVCSVGAYSLGKALCASCLSPLILSCSSTSGLATSCIPGAGFNSTSGTCTACSPGSWSPGDRICVSCLGASKNGLGNGVGSCNGVDGRVTSCNAGYGLLPPPFSSTPSPSLITISSTCVSCLPGSYSPQNSALLCIPCPAGSFAEKGASGSCTPCAVNFFSNIVGSTGCLACKAGLGANGGAAVCS